MKQTMGAKTKRRKKDDGSTATVEIHEESETATSSSPSLSLDTKNEAGLALVITQEGKSAEATGKRKATDIEHPATRDDAESGSLCSIQNAVTVASFHDYLKRGDTARALLEYDRVNHPITFVGCLLSCPDRSNGDCILDHIISSSPISPTAWDMRSESCGLLLLRTMFMRGEITRSMCISESLGASVLHKAITASSESPTIWLARTSLLSDSDWKTAIMPDGRPLIQAVTETICSSKPKGIFREITDLNTSLLVERSSDETLGLPCLANLYPHGQSVFLTSICHGLPVTLEYLAKRTLGLDLVQHFVCESGRLSDVDLAFESLRNSGILITDDTGTRIKETIQAIRNWLVDYYRLLSGAIDQILSEEHVLPKVVVGIIKLYSVFSLPTGVFT